MKHDRLIQACQENTDILTSLKGWLEDEYYKQFERMVNADTETEYLRHQGAARKLRELPKTLDTLLHKKPIS